jgi:hypothetical protein
MLRFASQQLNEARGYVVRQDEEFAAVLMSLDIEAENIIQVAEHPLLRRAKIHLGSLLEVEKWLEQPGRRLLVEVR